MMEMNSHSALASPSTSTITPIARRPVAATATATNENVDTRPGRVVPALLWIALPLVVFASNTPTVDSRAIVSAKCYFFGPGTTISGADYRREHGLSRKACAESCKTDVCCMGFEWLEGRCTLKSRSLNGTIEKLPDAYFGLCLDFDDGDRDRFWDHELGGNVVLRADGVPRDTCAETCAAQENSIIHSWRPHSEEQSVGDCECIDVLHSVRLSFGAAAGFLM